MELLGRDRTICGGLFAVEKICFQYDAEELTYFTEVLKPLHMLRESAPKDSFTFFCTGEETGLPWTFRRPARPPRDARLTPAGVLPRSRMILVRAAEPFGPAQKRFASIPRSLNIVS